MSDNIHGETTSLFDDDDFEEIKEDDSTVNKGVNKKSGNFLGMTSFQRFVIAVMFMIAVCILGTMCLLLTGRIGLAI
jgi:hypothetical protein